MLCEWDVLIWPFISIFISTKKWFELIKIALNIDDYHLLNRTNIWLYLNRHIKSSIDSFSISHNWWADWSSVWHVYIYIHMLMIMTTIHCYSKTYTIRKEHWGVNCISFFFFCLHHIHIYSSTLISIKLKQTIDKRYFIAI
jgi:hypothetical protein